MVQIGDVELDSRFRPIIAWRHGFASRGCPQTACSLTTSLVRFRTA